MVVDNVVETVAAVTVKVALAAPAFTVTDAGTRAASTLLLVTVPVGCPWLLTED